MELFQKQTKREWARKKKSSILNIGLFRCDASPWFNKYSIIFGR